MRDVHVPFPNRFHDLVFGHELGQGSFSSVKYARQITKGRPRDDWPEFAVKIISTNKIKVSNDPDPRPPGPGDDIRTPRV